MLYSLRGYILGLLGVLLLLCAPAPFAELYPVLPVSILLILLASFVRIQARRSIGSHTRGSSHAADYLVKTGLYSQLRHPLYLSNTYFALAAILFHLGLTTMVVPFSVVVVAFEILLSKKEDAFLHSKFGEEWLQWKNQTPAFIPRLRMDADAASAENPFQRTFAQSFISDAWTWFWLLLFFGLIVLRKYWGGCVLCLAS